MSAWTISGLWVGMTLVVIIRAGWLKQRRYFSKAESGTLERLSAGTLRGKNGSQQSAPRIVPVPRRRIPKTFLTEQTVGTLANSRAGRGNP